MLDQEANIEAENAVGYTSPFEACQYGHLEILRLLLKHGANVEKQDRWNGTALHLLLCGTRSRS